MYIKIRQHILGNRTQSENRDTLNKDETVMKRNGNTNRFSIGTIITKYWNGLPYKGIVTSNTDKYYKILHEDNDNDKEELNHTEVDRYMKKNRGEGRMTGEIGQRMRLRKPLGDWNILANKSERLWPFYYSDKTDTSYTGVIKRNGTRMENSIMTVTP